MFTVFKQLRCSDEPRSVEKDHRDQVNNNQAKNDDIDDDEE